MQQPLASDQPSANDATATRPFLKWVGGKRQLLDRLQVRFPTDFNNYYEPFIGGGAVFFGTNFTHATIGDINPELINAYSVVQTEVAALITLLKQHQEQHCKDFFYETRALDPETLNPVERAARLIYLNKTCFNGLYRVNRKGQFNVPMGSYKNPMICDEANIMAAHTKLRDTTIILGDYQKIAESAQPRDFVYFDPPYEPVSRSSNFVAYAQDGFSQADQEKLSRFFRELSDRGVHCMLSNSAADLIRQLYDGFQIESVQARRAVNSVASKRGNVSELLITNYRRR